MDIENKSLYGLIGYPLGHSFSQNFFNEKFKSEGINAEYVNFEIPEIDFVMELLSENPDLKGLNVTIPYKKLIIPYLDDLDLEAKEIGAVNVIKIMTKDDDLYLKGFNSDVIGFSKSIAPLLRSEDKKALVLGTGGASKAVKYGLQKLGLAVTSVSRTQAENQITYDEITDETMKNHTVIVNTTPLGMYPKIDTCPNIPYELLTNNHLCYDLVYNPEETLFLKQSRERGARIKNGLEMLLLQAYASWEIWNK